MLLCFSTGVFAQQELKIDKAAICQGTLEIVNASVTTSSRGDLRVKPSELVTRQNFSRMLNGLPKTTNRLTEMATERAFMTVVNVLKQLEGEGWQAGSHDNFLARCNLANNWLWGEANSPGD